MSCLCQRAQFQLRVGKVDALFRSQSSAGRWYLRHLHLDAFAVVARHQATDLAVVQPHAVAHPDVFEGGRQRAMNACRGDDLPGGAALRSTPGRRISCQDECVADLEGNGRRHARQVADAEELRNDGTVAVSESNSSPAAA